MNKLIKQNKQLKIVAATMGLMLIGATAVICGQAFTLNACRSEVVVIKENVDNDLHNVIFSYRDTTALDNLTDNEYQKLIADHILPRGNE